MEEEAGLAAGRLDLLRSHPMLLKSVDMMMRLPPLYLMDWLLVQNLGVADQPTMQQAVVQSNISEHITNSTDLYLTFGQLYGGSPALLLLPHLLRFCFSLAMLLTAFLLFLLPTSSLFMFYRHLLCLAAVPATYAGHKLLLDRGRGAELVEKHLHPTLGSLLGQDTHLSALLCNYALQASLAVLLTQLLAWPRLLPRPLQHHLPGLMLLPCLLPLLPLPAPVLSVAPLLAAILPACLLGCSLGQQAGAVMSHLTQLAAARRDFVNNFGLNAALETEWGRVGVPGVLRLFWLTRLALLLPGLQWTSHIACLRAVLVSGSDTVVAVLGLTSLVSSLSHWAGLLFQLSLGTETDEDKSVASVSAVLFFVLALQTGLTGMESEKRFQQICKNLCLLLTAILHFVHSMVQPVLLSISASRSSQRATHIRALAICIFLLFSPSCLVTVLWLHFSLGTWLLAVTAFCVEVVVKVLVTVTIYSLFMWDAWCQEDGLWESLDDWVYYIKAVGNTVEFLFAVFLFFNGGWILLFESGGTIRAVMMLIHAYFNIWCEAKSGWSTFCKRRTAVAKIESLDDATAEEIEKHADVCAICYQEMVAAKLTRCKHMFHAICLRKWLYMQDNCPMCHEQLHRSDATSQTEEAAALNIVDNNNEESELEDDSENYTDISDSDEVEGPV